MPLGSAVKSTIDIDYTRAQGVNSSGRIIFQPPRTRVGTTMISPLPISVEIVEGFGSVSLVRLPTGVYRVREEIDGRLPYEFKFALPLDSPDTIQYEEIAPVTPVPIYFTSIRTINNVSPDPVTGNINVGGGESVPDATDSVKGILRLTGDLAGTATAPSLSEERISEIAAKYIKPALGIPLADLDANVQASLMLANTSAQPADLSSIIASIPDNPGDIGAQPAGDYATNASVGELDARLDAIEINEMVHPYLASEYGIYSATGRDPLQFLTSSAWGNNDHNISLHWVPAGKPISKIAVAVRTASSYSANATPAQVKVYDVAGVLLGSSPHDSTMWAAKGWSIQVLSSPIAPQSTGRFVYVGISGGGFSGHSPAWPTGINSDWPEGTSVGMLNGRRRAFYSSSAAGLPSSFNPVSYGTATSYIPLIGLIA